MAITKAEAQNQTAPNPNSDKMFTANTPTLSADQSGAQPINVGDPTSVVTVDAPSGADSAANPSGTGNVPVSSDVGQTALINNKAQEGTLVQEVLTNEIKNVQEQGGEASALAASRIAEEAALAKTATSDATKFGNAQENIIKEGAAKQDELDAQRTALADDRLIRDNELLRKEQGIVKSRQESEVEVAKQALALQKAKDDQALTKAQVDIEVAHQKANWGMAKLGLAFSQGAVNTTQQIATNGANKLAELKIQASFNQAKNTVEVAKLMESINATQAQYDVAINKTIDKYTDLKLDVKSSIEARITGVQNNLLLNNKEKAAKIEEIKREYVTNKRGLEDGLIAEQKDISNDLINKSTKLEQEFKNKQAQSEAKIGASINSGAWFNYSSSKKAEILRSAGLSSDDGVAIEAKVLGDSVRTEVTKVMPKGFSATFEQEATIRKNTKEWLNHGYSFDEAVKKSVESELGKTQEFKNQKTLAALSDKVNIAKLNAALTPSSGRKPDVQLYKNTDGVLYGIDKNSGFAQPIVIGEEDASGNLNLRNFEFDKTSSDSGMLNLDELSLLSGEDTAEEAITPTPDDILIGSPTSKMQTGVGSTFQ